MTLKDISFSGFFKVFGVLNLFIFSLTAIIGLIAYLTVPDRLTIGETKILGILTLKIGGAKSSLIVLFFLGLFNSIVTAVFYALISLVLTKIPFIGRLKISHKAYDEKVFD